MFLSRPDPSHFKAHFTELVKCTEKHVPTYRWLKHVEFFSNSGAEIASFDLDCL